MEECIKYYLGFSYYFGIGPYKFQKLVEYFGDVKTAYHAKQSILSGLLGPITSQKFDLFRKNFEADRTLDMLSKKDIHVLCIGTTNYPKSLAHIPDPPICIYVRGSKEAVLGDEENNLAIVGTRSPTTYGISIVSKIADVVAKSNIQIISGMALGIDALAHKAAVLNQKPTVAVLGCGIDVIYPPSNKQLYYSIIENNGAIISEFPPHQTVFKGLFIARNRLISGLSKGVLVVEGAVDSGSLITARYGAEQGKNVYAIPGPISSSLSQAPNNLIKQGAKMVSEPQDILEDYQIITNRQKIKNIEGKNETQNKIINLLAQEPLTIDEICEKILVEDISSQLTILEINGMIRKNQLSQFELV